MKRKIKIDSITINYTINITTFLIDDTNENVSEMTVVNHPVTSDDNYR